MATLFRRTISAIVLLFLTIGCATMQPITKEYHQNSVLCKDVGQYLEQGALSPKDITDIFNLEGKVYLYTVFTWPDIEQTKGRHRVTHKWYTAENKIQAKSENYYFFGKPPFYIIGSVPTITLGLGKHYVEFSVDDNFIVRKDFEIKSK